MSPTDRRQAISEWAAESGWVNIADLARALHVTQDTIRNDLDVLTARGLVERTRGGATSRVNPRFPHPRSTLGGSSIAEKARIGEAALAYLPQSGAVFIAPGSTTLQLAVSLPAGRLSHVYTNSLPVAEHLVVNSIAPVYFPGGTITSWALASDWSMSESALDSLYWEVLFMGALAIDVTCGISEVDIEIAKHTRSLINHSHKVVVLCDSSKIGRLAHAVVGPVRLADVLITDSGCDPRVLGDIAAEGVQVVVAEPETPRPRDGCSPVGDASEPPGMLR